MASNLNTLPEPLGLVIEEFAAAGGGGGGGNLGFWKGFGGGRFDWVGKKREDEFRVFRLFGGELKIDVVSGVLVLSLLGAVLVKGFKTGIKDWILGLCFFGVLLGLGLKKGEMQKSGLRDVGIINELSFSLFLQDLFHGKPGNALGIVHSHCDHTKCVLGCTMNVWFNIAICSYSLWFVDAISLDWKCLMISGFHTESCIIYCSNSFYRLWHCSNDSLCTKRPIVDDNAMERVGSGQGGSGRQFQKAMYGYAEKALGILKRMEEMIVTPEEVTSWSFILTHRANIARLMRV
ncbi:hypothetical protein NC653_030574 [Populus alba x Populus x berolinensis]|uniref:Uncharacterized protein n=1 Tax=Populus alba x Populus x berolinensis TaxID=444605 RepID=A0AAD6LWV2_9ROSI|nr:hypothetical protein NC653_030574 [Populus alba x Populus x berolinensis]